jgi:GH25 family lysozyme M1 (1,4-beta-N-acetylmuramidase)
MLWQATSSGKVDGVPGFVDIDILYKNKIKWVINYYSFLIAFRYFEVYCYY